MGNSSSRGSGGGSGSSRSYNDRCHDPKVICIHGRSTGNSGNDGSGNYPSGNINGKGGEERGGGGGSSSTNQESSSQSTYSSGDNYVVQELTTNLNKWQNLGYIDFSGKQLGDDNGKQFNEAFRDAKLPNLLTLVLANNQISDSGAQYLVYSLIHHYNNNLITLILANNNLTNNGVTPFADGFNQINTTTFPNGAISSGQITKLKTLDLRGNDKVCFIGKLYFFKNIDKCKTKDTSILFDKVTINTGDIHSLGLNNKLLNDSHIPWITGAFNLKWLASMHNLNLSNNQIGDNGAKLLADSLAKGKFPNLKKLHLEGNKITTTGTGFLSKALEVVEQNINVVLKSIQNASKSVAQFAIKEMLHIAKSNGISTKEVLTNQETIEYCKKGIPNVVGNLGLGYFKCWTKLDKPIAIYEMDFQYVATALMVNIMNPAKKPVQVYCTIESTVFSVVDEDFANCLTGLDSELNND